MQGPAKKKTRASKPANTWPQLFSVEAAEGGVEAGAGAGTRVETGAGVGTGSEAGAGVGVQAGACPQPWVPLKFVQAEPVQPVWQDVDRTANEKTGVSLAQLGQSLPPYEKCLQCDQ